MRKRLQLPEGDVVSRSYKEFLAELDVCMGGRVAEEMIFGVENVTSGASSDLHKATEVAKRMVCLYVIYLRRTTLLTMYLILSYLYLRLTNY